MAFSLDSSWQIRPAGGNSGTAFIGVRNQQKIFLKRNSSPFLPALSMEKITPRMLWMKRMPTGDVLTAQEWIEGRILTRDEMHQPMVAQMVKKFHQSMMLRSMFDKVAGEIYSPRRLLKKIQRELNPDLAQNEIVKEAFFELDSTKHQLITVEQTVCHADLNRNNWLMSNDGEIFLVDWDSAMLADPAIDLSAILTRYVPHSNWINWLQAYGANTTPELQFRIHWYGIFNVLNDLNLQYQLKQRNKMNEDFMLLRKMIRSR